MNLILENLPAISVAITITGILFAAFIASPYEIYFEDSEDIEEF